MAINQSSQSLGKSKLVSGLGKPDITDTDGKLYSDNSGGNLYQKNTSIPGQWENILKTNRITISLRNNTSAMSTATNSWIGIPGNATVDSLYSSDTFTYSSTEVLVSSTGDGTFANISVSGTGGFATNNWTVENGSQTNKWYVGVTGASPSGRSQFGAYVSSDNGATNTYVNTTSVVWFYRDVVLPAYTVSYDLSFVIKVFGRALLDYTRVYSLSTSIAPTAGTNRSDFLAEYSELEEISGQFTNASLNISPPVLSTGTQSRRLAFNWVNTNNGGAIVQPPSSIDQISLIANVPMKITYSGSQSKFKAVLTGSFQAATNITNVGVQIVKNRTTSGVESSFNISTNFKDSFAVQDTFTLSNGDYIEPFLNNKVSNASITVSDLQLSIWEVPY